MKKKALFLLSILFIGFFVGYIGSFVPTVNAFFSTSSYNYVPNHSFENPTSFSLNSYNGWAAWNNDSYPGAPTFSTAYAHEGSYSMGFLGNYWMGCVIHFNQSIPVASITKLSVWTFKASGGTLIGSVDFTALFSDGTTAHLYSGGSDLLFQNSWTENVMNLAGYTSKNISGLQFYGAGTYNVYLDDVTLDVGAPYLEANFENIDSDLTDWAFTNWKYYDFSLVVQNRFGNVSDAAISFSVPTGSYGTVLCNFTASNWGDEWVYSSSISDPTRFGEPILMKDGSWVQNVTDDTTIITFPIWFTTQCLDVYESGGGVNVYATVNFTSGFKINWYEAGGDFFYIYNQGGYSKIYGSTGGAGALTGGSWAQLQASEGESCYNDIWFRDLQHIKMLPEIHFIAGAETFDYEVTVEYSLGTGEWIEGWKCEISASYVSYVGIFAGNVWINMTCAWFAGNGTAYVWQKTDNIYMFYHGNTGNVGDPGWEKFWVDQWFDVANGSSMGCGRINAYEYPMVDNAGAWLHWLANNWGVKDDVAKESSFSCPLRDASGNIISGSEIQMIRVIVGLEVGSASGGQEISIDNLPVLDYTFSDQMPFVGMQTPVFDETTMPTMTNTGLFGALASMISAQGKWLSENFLYGGLNVWGSFVSFLDTIAGWLGAPGAFSAFLDWISSGFSYLIDSFVYVVTVFTSFFEIFASTLGGLLSILSQAFTSFANFFDTTWSFINGGLGGAANLWSDLDIGTWITVGLVFYPLYLIIVWDQEGADAAIGQLRMIWGIMSWLAHFFIDVIRMISELIGRVIESIPVVE